MGHFQTKMLRFLALYMYAKCFDNFLTDFDDFSNFRIFLLSMQSICSLKMTHIFLYFFGLIRPSVSFSLYVVLMLVRVSSVCVWMYYFFNKNNLRSKGVFITTMMCIRLCFVLFGFLMTLQSV